MKCNLEASGSCEYTEAEEAYDCLDYDGDGCRNPDRLSGYGELLEN